MLKSPLMIIVPARNEEASIGRVVRSVKRVLPGTPLLVIDDHSSDATARVAAGAGARVVRLPKHLGLAGCLRTGYRIALEQGFETVVRVDGDGQHEAADIPGMLRALQETGADIVIGSRFLTPGRWQSSLVRSMGIAALRRLVARSLGQTIHDPTSGFIGVNRRALELFANSQAPYPEALALIALKRTGCRIHEIPCRMYPRRAGRSSMTFLTSLCYTGRILAGLPRKMILRENIVGPPRGAPVRDACIPPSPESRPEPAEWAANPE
jgi:glycosyltransferase involved in cell wall biosynthesis